VTAQRPFETVIASLEAHNDLGDREHVLQIHEHRGHPLVLGRLQHPPQQGRLAVAARSDQAERVTTVGEGEQVVGLGVAVDHLLRCQGA